MTKSENILKAIKFEKPDYIPMTFHINDSCWNHYPQEWLKEQMASHKFLFPDYKYNSKPYTPSFENTARKDRPFLDDWNCLWKTTEDGITGTVVDHPLGDWSNLENYTFPNPAKVSGLGPVNWRQFSRHSKFRKLKGELLFGGLPHGHTFLRLCDIRGYENVLFDMVDESPQLLKLIDKIEEFNSYTIDKLVSLNYQVISYPEDLGMEFGPMISPDLFRKYIKPVYKRLMKPARDAGAFIHMHSDGDVRTLAEDLVDGGVDILNIQDMVNGIDWIKEKFQGKVCIDLDIDRVAITNQGTPEQVDNLIKEEVEMLGSAEGGLMMIYGLYPGVPRKNVEALMNAMEKYALYYS